MQYSQIIGECIEGIGNSSQRLPVERAWNGLAWLSDGYTSKTSFSSLPQNTTHYPLFNAADFRRTVGYLYRGNAGYVGYHFHNFFPSIYALRKKYKTYGHPVAKALDMPLEEIHKNLQSLIHCGRNMTLESKNSQYPLVEGGWKTLKGQIPWAFQVPGYVEARQRELRDMLELDKMHANRTNLTDTNLNLTVLL